MSRIHDDLLWLGDSIVCINNDLIHKVTGLSNKGSNLMIVEANLNMHFDETNMKVNSIQDGEVRLLRKFLGYKFNHWSRIDSVLEGIFGSQQRISESM